MKVKNDQDVFIKPLLEFSKQQLRDYLSVQKLEWKEDPTNQSNKYKRNALRHDVIPVVSEFCGGLNALHSRLMTLADQSTLVREWIDKEVRILILLWR